MQRSFELTMTRHQRIEHHVRGTSEPQFAGVQPVTPKALQQPRIDRISLSLDALNLAECLDQSECTTAHGTFAVASAASSSRS